MAILFLVLTALAGTAKASDVNQFAMMGTDILHDDEELGIVNGRITCGVSKEFLGRVNGIWAPPYVSSDFALRWTLNGSELPLSTMEWRPDSVVGVTETGPLRVSFAMWLAADRSIVQALRISPTDNAEHSFDLALAAGGTLDVVQRWEFARAASATKTTDTQAPSGLVYRNGDAAIAVQCHELEPRDGKLSRRYTLKDGEEAILFASVSLGAADDAVAATELALREARLHQDPFAPRETPLPFALPELKTDNPALDALFNRSLVHLIMNRWDVPEFVLRPYYATGSVKGGCLCNYLWNFGEVWEILPLVDPAAMRAHIRHFLQCDLTQHFAFDPIEGKAFGPWYPVNQEKIIGLIYYYVLLTGDRDFLKEPLLDTTIAGLAVQHALLRDDVSKPVALIDYGPSNSHLELRKQYAYNHVMPDLNGRRYENYLRAADLSEWAGAPRPELRERAEQLKAAMAPLWDDEAKWFHFINGEGKQELRYTMQLFKLFNSAVLSPAQVDGLLSHFNEREFFSQYGMHSMSKLDPAYDQVDIDNGGGGACTCFPPQLAERLYKMGKVAEADDILKRILWWGARMPYWGDSIVANEIAYRKDTPLQCTLDGATVAQTIIFGLFGIVPQPDGSIVVAPCTSGLFRQGTLSVPGLRKEAIRIELDAEKFVVECGDRRWEAARGETVTIPAYKDSPK